MQHPHSLAREGVSTGLIGGLVVALWLLVRDTLSGHPLLTPNVLGQLLVFGDTAPNIEQRFPLAIAGFALLHFLGFILLGIAATWLIHLSERRPFVRMAILIGFFVVAIFVLGMTQALSEQIRTVLPAWAALVGVLLAGLSMGLFLLRRHPRLWTGHQPAAVGDSEEKVSAPEVSEDRARHR